MHLESHATPLGDTPQQRYASLHRAIEQGLDSDDVWSELASVCHALDHRGEALHCVQRIQDAGRRARAERGLFDPAGRDPRGSTAAPAASSAGPDTSSRARAPRSDAPPSAVEHLVDACQYLLHQQMPAIVLATMLAFPLVIGVGGFLTAGGSLLLLAAIAALPGLCVLCVVAGMAREILVTSSDGEGDVPELPGFRQLGRGAAGFALDLALVVTLFGGPLPVLVSLEAPAYAVLGYALLATLAAPMAFTLRQLRRDLRALSPIVLLRALLRAGRGYPLVATAVVLAFAPAVAVGFSIHDRPVWVQIALIGPLVVLPVFATARLLGAWADSHRVALQPLLTSGSVEPRRRQRANARAEREPVRRRDAAHRTPARATAPSDRAQAIGEAPQHRPRAPLAIEGRRPSGLREAPAAQDAAEPSADLSSLPGAFVVRGADRERSGAASQRS